MKRLLTALGLIILPCAVFAEDCQVVEFPDHFDVTCVGDAKPVPIPKQGLIRSTAQPPAQSPAPDQQNTATGQADIPAAAQNAGSAPSAGTAPSSGSAPSTVPATPYLKKPGRQGRPSAADMNAAIEARRRLILDMRLKNPSQ